jgi:hypothetical protein
VEKEKEEGRVISPFYRGRERCPNQITRGNLDFKVCLHTYHLHANPSHCNTKITHLTHITIMAGGTVKHNVTKRNLE